MWFRSNRSAPPPIEFNSDIASSGLNKWPPKFNADKMSIVNDPILGTARKVINMTIHEADGGGGRSHARPRGQLQTPAALVEGSEYWVGSGLLLPVGYPTPTLAWGFNAFMHTMGTPATGYPPLAIGFVGNTGQFGRRREPAKGEVWAWSFSPVYGAWMDIVRRVKMSSNPAVGFVEIYVNAGLG